MPPPNRIPYVPGQKEVAKRIHEAIAALEAGDYQIIDENQNVRTFQSLGVSTMQKVLELVLDFLDEIVAAGPQACFCGIGGKVEFCNKQGFHDVRLYAYSWNSGTMRKSMYLKFGLKKKGETPVFTYMHLSCHDDE
jgi:hypothetical protein